jgi:hypothetical protein
VIYAIKFHSLDFARPLLSNLEQATKKVNAIKIKFFTIARNIRIKRSVE